MEDHFTVCLKRNNALIYTVVDTYPKLMEKRYFGTVTFDKYVKFHILARHYKDFLHRPFHSSCCNYSTIPQWTTICKLWILYPYSNNFYHRKLEMCNSYFRHQCRGWIPCYFGTITYFWWGTMLCFSSHAWIHVGFTKARLGLSDKACKYTDTLIKINK